MSISLTVAAIWLVAVITPGPNFFITVHSAVNQKKRLSVFTVFGIVAGTLLWSLFGYFGISTIFKAVPFLYFFLKIAGGLYLVYMGLSLLRNQSQSVHDIPAKKQHSWFYFKQGLFTNLLNPKTGAFISSLFAATIPHNADALTGIKYISIICAISITWYLFVSLVFSSDIAHRYYKKFQLYVEKIAGTVFVIFGLRLAVSE